VEHASLNETLNNLVAAGTLRLRVVLDFKLEGFEFVNHDHVGEHPNSPEATSSGSGSGLIEAAASSGYTTYGERLYKLDRTVQPPRVGSMNSAVLTLLNQLPPAFTRDQFEAVVPKAMRFNPVTRNFGVRTSFPTIERAQQAYFSEFKKRGWVVPVKPAPDFVSQDKFVSIQEFVNGWATKNGHDGKCLASLLPTTDHKIGVTVAGTTDWLELPNGDGPATKAEREQIKAWLTDSFGKSSPEPKLGKGHQS
jgi:hypothetical protein